MKKIFIVFLVAVISFFIFGNKKEDKIVDNRPHVVSTFCFIDDFVRYIGDDYINSTLLIPADLDPHSYEPGKGDADQIMSAQAIFYHGLNLENNANLLRMINEHKNSVAVGKKVYQSSSNKFLMSKKEVDPHFWMDISLWLQIIDPITETLSSLDPEHQSIFESRGTKLKQNLLDLEKKVKIKLDSIPKEKRYLVTTHSAFQYFVQRYICSSGEKACDRSIAPEGFCPEVQVSLFDLSRVTQFIEKHRVTTLFREYSIPPNSLSRIKELGSSSGPLAFSSDVLYSDSFIADKKGEMCYTRMIEHNANVIFNELNQKESPCD